ncbi:hypothetical protein QE152_g32070 [Popillia japonica]|uniref:Uncharacterized protein n=1 Tax=Popillia japonica TaxID=7064 RepID=A0AAW1J0W7_POPJA
MEGEFAFRRTHKNIGIVMEKQTKPRTQVAKQLEKVIIKADGKQYADILRTVKGSVNIDKAGIMVNAIKKTTRGDVMVEIRRGGKEKAETLRQEIIKNNRGTKVEIKNKNDTVFLTGIDGDVGKDEIVQAIKDSIGGEMQLHHRAKECTGESYCLTCKKNGHRADQTRCPYYRKLIHEKTKELANEKAGRKDNTKTNPEKRQARLRSNSGVEVVRKNAHENTPN